MSILGSDLVSDKSHLPPNLQKLFKYVLNSTEDEKPFGGISTVTSAEEVGKPLEPVTVSSTYKGYRVGQYN